jgi:hypothetical protein
MNVTFTVHVGEIISVDEKDFISRGGDELYFGRVEGDVVTLFARGSACSISSLARDIIRHHTAR